MSLESSSEELSAIERYLEPDTGALIFYRYGKHNLEACTVAGAKLLEGHYRKITHALRVL